MATNPLDSTNLLDILCGVLPRDATLSNPTTALAALSHAIHTALGFRQVKPAPPAVPDGETASSEPKERNKLSSSWFERNAEEESFAISYRHEQSSLLFEVRTGRLGGRIVVNAVAVEDNKTATLDINSSDYLSPSTFPQTVNSSLSLETLFNSSTRFTDFVSLYKIQIIQKLLPGLNKPGYEESSSSTSTSSSAPPPRAGPSQSRPHAPEAPERLGAPPGFPQVGRNPLEIGRSDLDPLGGTMGRLPGAGGDGMVVGPNHPLFGRERDQNDPLRMPGRGGGAGQTGPWGGDGYLPPLGAPPGARFDPVGPFGAGPGGIGMGQQGVPRRNWGDEFQPPGFDNEMGGGGGGMDPLNPGRGSGFGGGNFGGFPRGPPGGAGGFGGGGGGFGNMFG